MKKSIKHATFSLVLSSSFAGVATATALALVLVACGSPTNPSVKQDGQFPISVSRGATPTFSWSGGGAEALHVIQSGVGDGTQGRWQLTARDTIPGIPSPVTYGLAPGASLELLAPARLITGVTYAVVIYRTDGLIGSTDFVP